MSDSETTPPAGRLSERPQAGVDAAASSAAMADRILGMPAAPYRDGAYVVRVAEILGRTSGRLLRVPIAVTQLDGVKFLISPSSRRPWALNLKASGWCRLVSSDGTEDFAAVRAPFEEALPALRYYLGELAWAAAQFPFAATDEDEKFRQHYDEVAVFELNPR